MRRPYCQSDQAKIKALRTAAKEGFDAIEGGDYTVLHSGDEIDAFMMGIHEEVLSESAK